MVLSKFIKLYYLYSFMSLSSTSDVSVISLFKSYCSAMVQIQRGKRSSLWHASVVPLPCWKHYVGHLAQTNPVVPVDAIHRGWHCYLCLPCPQILEWCMSDHIGDATCCVGISLPAQTILPWWDLRRFRSGTTWICSPVYRKHFRHTDGHDSVCNWILAPVWTVYDDRTVSSGEVPTGTRHLPQLQTDTVCRYGEDIFLWELALYLCQGSSSWSIHAIFHHQIDDPLHQRPHTGTHSSRW